MEINQGDVYWIDLGEPSGSEPGYRRPFVIIQNNVFNQSNIQTTVVCALTTNLDRGEAPGNVLLNAGEANLPQRSVANVSQLFTVDRRDLEDYIGTLDESRIRNILKGISLVLEPR